MKSAEYLNHIILIILIVAVAVGVSFAQNAKLDAQRFQRDARQLAVKIKASKNGVYLLRLTPDAEASVLSFKLRNRLWVKLSETKKLEIARLWWQKWRAIRGATETGILSMMNAGSEEIVCLMERCYVPACEL